jgi:hypothetical protein
MRAMNATSAVVSATSQSSAQFLFHKSGLAPNREPTSNGRPIHASDRSPEADPGPRIGRFPEKSINSMLFHFSLDVIDATGHTQMTPVIAEVVTGSGKTFTVVIPILEK